MFIDKFKLLNIVDKEKDVHMAVKTHRGTALVGLNNPSHLRKFKLSYTMGAQRWFPAKLSARKGGSSWEVQYDGRNPQPAAPCTLHPAPYTLHPTPYTLHPTPYTLHPTPFTLHPTPYTLHPTPYTLHPSPFTLHLIITVIKWIQTSRLSIKYSFCAYTEGMHPEHTAGLPRSCCPQRESFFLTTYWSESTSSSR